MNSCDRISYISISDDTDTDDRLLIKSAQQIRSKRQLISDSSDEERFGEDDLSKNDVLKLEDRQFTNRSFPSSDSESDEPKKNNFRKKSNRRRSIYDNPESDSSESAIGSPKVYRRIVRKKRKLRSSNKENDYSKDVMQDFKCDIGKKKINKENSNSQMNVIIDSSSDEASSESQIGTTGNVDDQEAIRASNAKIFKEQDITMLEMDKLIRKCNKLQKCIKTSLSGKIIISDEEDEFENNGLKENKKIKSFNNFATGTNGYVDDDDDDDFKNYSFTKNKEEKKFNSFSSASSKNYDAEQNDYDDDNHSEYKPDYENNNDYDNIYFNINKIPMPPNISFKTKDLGAQALQTFNKQGKVTKAKLEMLHESLLNRPKEDVRHPDPTGLNISLMPHQQYALAWLKWREQQKPKGGILADDMGLGKTLSMVSLVLDSKNNDSDISSTSESSGNDNKFETSWVHKGRSKRRYGGGTLVVCPASLIKQWENEVKNRCNRGLLTVYAYHGKHKKNTDAGKLSKHDIVITTYQLLVKEQKKKGALYQIEWHRIILDEAHYIRNHKSQACMAICKLYGKRRWALTGTPIQNKELDLYAILKFLKCSPFDDFRVWKRWVDNKNNAGTERLRVIMKSLLLRRTKEELQAEGTIECLPEKKIRLIEINLDPEEDLVYKKILLFSQGLFAQFLIERANKQREKDFKAGNYVRLSSLDYTNITEHLTETQKELLKSHEGHVSSHAILVLILRLRQMCCHPGLINSMLDKLNDAELNGLNIDNDEDVKIITEIGDMSMFEEEQQEIDAAVNYEVDLRTAGNLLTKDNPVFNDGRQSSKTRAVVALIEEVINLGDKVIVVSQWTSFLSVIEKSVRDIDNAKYAMFTGDVAVKHRQEIIDKLNDPTNKMNILLLSLNAGGVGLNLVGANHLILTDIHWNPQLEAQAQDRIYRFGQNKPVYIYKILCRETIEDRIKTIQDRKLEIVNDIFTGSKTISSKFTIEDIKTLFS